MTEYEIMDLAETINGDSVTATGVYFSILTAYLLVAYFAGTYSLASPRIFFGQR
jgi:hypothetical protein